MYSRPSGIGIAGDPLSYLSTLPSDNTCTQTHAIRKVHVTTLTNFKNNIQSHCETYCNKIKHSYWHYTTITGVCFQVGHHIIVIM